MVKFKYRSAGHPFDQPLSLGRESVGYAVMSQNAVEAF